jgi:hypothetical protein
MRTILGYLPKRRKYMSSTRLSIFDRNGNLKDCRNRNWSILLETDRSELEHADVFDAHANRCWSRSRGEYYPTSHSLKALSIVKRLATGPICHGQFGYGQSDFVREFTERTFRLTQCEKWITSFVFRFLSTVLAIFNLLCNNIQRRLVSIRATSRTLYSHSLLVHDTDSSGIS